MSRSPRSKSPSIELCTICLESLNSCKPHLFFCTNCNNRFHKKCIYHMIKFNRSQNKSSNCPICRKEINLAFSMIPLPPDRIAYYETELRHRQIANERTPLISTRCRHITCRIFLLCSGRCFFL